MPRQDSILNLDFEKPETIGQARRRLALMSAVFAHAPRVIVQESAEIYKKELMVAAPKGKTGNLKKSHGYRTFSKGGSWGARFFASYVAAFVIMGTKPHDIPYTITEADGTRVRPLRPGSATYYGIMLRNRGGEMKRAVVWSGAAHPYVRVHHPGTKANDYRNKAADAAIPQIAAVVRAAGLKVAKGIEL